MKIAEEEEEEEKRKEILVAKQVRLSLFFNSRCSLDKDDFHMVGKPDKIEVLNFCRFGSADINHLLSPKSFFLFKMVNRLKWVSISPSVW